MSRVPPIALAESRTEFVLMHRGCPPYGHRAFRVVAEVIEPISDLLDERCAWCQRRLRDKSDPELIGKIDPDPDDEF